MWLGSRTVLVAARIAMSSTGIVYLWSYWRILDFTWHGRSQLLGSSLCWCLIACLLLRGLGFGGWRTDRALSLVHFFAAQYLLLRSYPYPTVNEKLYVMLAFWCCFIRLNPPKDAHVPSWAPVLLGINIGIFVCTSGLEKCHDAIWQEGTGFYHFLRLNWVRHPWADWMLTETRFLRFMNYAALAMELAILPLMLFRWTRPFACVLLFVFFLSLIWPFRMDMIGPVGICIALTVTAGAIAALAEKQIMPWIGWIMLGYVAVAGTVDLTSVFGAASGWMSPSQWRAFNFLVAGWYPRSIGWVDEHSTFMRPNPLFVSQQTLNIWAWRVLVKMPDGSTVEPVRVFNADRSGGTSTQAWASTRHYQACVYTISDFANSGGLANTDQIDVLMEHAIKRAGGVSASLVVSPLDQPFDGWRSVHDFQAARSR